MAWLPAYINIKFLLKSGCYRTLSVKIRFSIVLVTFVQLIIKTPLLHVAKVMIASPALYFLYCMVVIVWNSMT